MSESTLKRQTAGPNQETRRTNGFGQPYSPLRQYVSRRSSSRIKTHDLPAEPNAVGVFSLWAVLWGVLFLVVPLSYLYIVLILLRELCTYFPDFSRIIERYIPLLFSGITVMQKSSKFVEFWCILEAIFFVGLKLQVWWIQSRDPLEASLSCAPLMELDERQILWTRMLEMEKDDPAAFISGWFFSHDIHRISKYDVREFITWSMFEGRNQEHLTREELTQLERFVEQLEHAISVNWYGNRELAEKNEQNHSSENSTLRIDRPCFPRNHAPQARPKKVFQFPEEVHSSPPSFFSDLYESYRNQYEKYRNMVENADFHPVQDLKNLVTSTTQQIVEAEESAMATARATASQTATQMYTTLVQPGSDMDKQLTALSQATHDQLIQAFNSVKKGMKERLETAKFLSTRRKAIRQQLKGYHEMLHRLREMSSAVPSKQMAALMRRITESNDALERLENRARDAFVQATGYARKNLMFPRTEPNNFYKYSSDPLLGIATYPLAFHLLLLGCTEIPLRILMRRKNFERREVGSVSYYFHPGQDVASDYGEEEEEKIPIVFVHGIGIGLIVYQPLIDELLKSGRPIILPEIPYVSGFRPWQSPSSVLPPAVVCSTLTAILATHGFLRGTFAGHSYGTSWLSYMCKYSSHAVAALLFLDPICFCLHGPDLTKNFVYHRPDPGTSSYMVRTDVIVSSTIQRRFPWAWISLFLEQVEMPCSIFLSDEDGLVPVRKVEKYFLDRGIVGVDFTPGMDCSLFKENRVNLCMFRGHEHGGWTTNPTHHVPVIAECVEVLCASVEKTK